MKTLRTGTWILAAAMVASAAPMMFAQQEGPVPTTATVSIDAKGKPVDASMLTLEVNGRKTPIDSLTPATPRGVELAILIDDGLRQSVALQLSDISKFIETLPPQVRVIVGYMSDGTVQAKTGFIADRAETQKELRIPFSVPGQSASPYICLSSFVRSWPSNARTARVVLMISDGVDPYNGSTSVMNQDSPYVQTAQEDSMRAGVTVYALYYGDAGIHGGNANFSGQSYLQQLTDSTGGRSLYEGTFNPVSFAPFLKDMQRDLNETYLLGFQADATHQKRDSLTRIKVKSNAGGVKVYAPDAVRPGLDE